MVSPMTDLSTQVSNQLMNDPRTEKFSQAIEVTTDRGIVTLKGNVPNTQVSEIAETIARNTPGVITVHNELKVTGK